MIIDEFELTESGEIKNLSEAEIEAVSGGAQFARDSETQCRLFIQYECDNVLHTVTILVNESIKDIDYAKAVRRAKSYIAVLGAKLGKACNFVKVDIKPENVVTDSIF